MASSGSVCQTKGGFTGEFDVTGILALMAASALGIDYGWQPVAGGGVEYIIRLEDDALELLKTDDIVSDLPPTLHAVRSYRVTTMKGPLPHQDEPPPDLEDVDTSLPHPVRDSGARFSAGQVSGPVEDDEALASDEDRDFEYNEPAPDQESDEDASRVARRPNNGKNGWDLRYAANQGTGRKSRSFADTKNNRSSRTTDDADDANEEDFGPELDDATGSLVSRGSRRANGDANDDESPSDGKAPASEGKAASLTANKPWTPLLIAVLALFASVACNFYQGWIIQGLRSRIRSTMHQQFVSRQSSMA